MSYLPTSQVSGLRALASLLRRNADYRRLASAFLVSLMGDWFAFVAVSAMVTEFTGRPGASALVYAATSLPVFAFSPLAGVVGDRVDRRGVLILANAARIFPALGLVLALHLESAALAIACVALIAALSAFFEPICEAVVPNLVEPADLSLAQAVMGVVWGTMLFVGAGVGGLVAATLGRQACFYLNALGFALSLVLIWRIRRPMQESLPNTRVSFTHALMGVWRLARAQAVTRSLLITKAAVGLGQGIVGLLASFVSVRFQSGDAGLGFLLSARGLGALMGPLIGQRLAGKSGRALFLVIGSSVVLYGGAYAVLPLADSIWFAACCVLVAHVGSGAQWVLSTYGLQVTTPDGLRGRVLSIDFSLATLSVGMSAVAADAASARLGLNAAAWLLAGLAVVFGVLWLVWTRPLWASASDPLAPAPPTPSV